MMRRITYVLILFLLDAARILANLYDGGIASTLFEHPSILDQGLLSRRSHPTLYFIRHGEKPSDSDDDGGLSPQGLKRAQCLREVFGEESGYNIGHIMAERKKRNGRRRRPLDTVKDLASDLHLKVDMRCGKEASRCVARAIRRYRGSQNILICWEHKRLANIIESVVDLEKNLQARHQLRRKAPSYPDDRYDLIYRLKYPYHIPEISILSEHCPGIDN